jgi:flagellar protein FliS
VSAESARLRYLTNAVSTASPAQRIVMLYDRLTLDITRAAAAAEDETDLAGHVGHTRHAQQIVAELRASLDLNIWDGADNLAGLYGYLLRELINAHAQPDPAALRALGEIVTDLRASWFAASEQLNVAATLPSLPIAAVAAAAADAAPVSPERVPATSGAWVG